MFLNSPVGLSVGGFAVNRSPLTAGSRDSHTEVKKNNQYVRSQAAESPVDDEVASQRGLLGEPALRCPKLMQSRSPLSFFSEPPTNSACSFLSQQENSDGQQFPLPRTSNVFQVPKFTLRAGLQDFETRIAQREQQWRALVGDDEEEGDEDGNNKNALEREQEHHQGPYYNIIDDEEVEDQQVVGSQQGRGYVEELGYYEDVKDWDEDYGAENREAVDRELEAEIDRVQQHVIQWTRPAASARKPVAASTRRRAGRGGRQDCFSKITVGSLNTSSTSSTLAQAGRVTTSRSSAGRRSRKNSKNNAPLLEHQQARATVGSSGRARSTAEEQKRFYRLLASREMVEQGAVEELPYRKLSSAARASSMKAGTRRAEDETVNLKSRAPSMIAAPNPQVEDTTTQGLKMNDETPNSAVTRRADEALGLSSRVLEPSPRLDFTAAAFTSPRFRKDGLSFFQPPARQVDLQLLASEKPNVLKAGMKQPAVQEALSASSSSTAASGGPPTSGNASALSSRRSSDATVASTVQPGALTQLITKSLEQLHVNCEGLSNISSNANLYTLSSSSSSPVEEKAAAAEMNDGEVLEVDLNVNVLEVAAGSPHLHVVESQDDDRGARLHGGRGTRAPRATGDQRRRPPSSSSRARSPLRLAGVASAKRRSRIPPGGGNDASVSTFHRSGSTTRRDQMVFGSLYADAQRRQNLAAEREQQRLAEELGLDKEDVEAGDNGEQLRLAMSARCTRAGSSVPGNMPASLQLRSSSVQPSLRNASRARSDRSRPEKGSVSASSSKKSTRSRTRSKDDNASNDDDRGQERQSCQKTHLEREAEFAEKRRLWREEAKARADRDREERELAECTFRPRREGPPPRFSPLSARGRNEGARSNQGPQLDIEQDVQQRERFSPGRGSTNKADRRPHRDFREDRMVALLRAGGAVFGDVETEGTRIT
ncbi:unnamed protein product [Amoebophrya sp. A25]|nr:unnamed protein product [Amoebophrya sp. A25]|eukprot:GSA25T00006034001.1